LRSAIIGGIAGSLGLWIGGEAFPWIGLAASALTLNWIRGGKPAADAMALLGITLATVSALLLPLTIARPLWGVPACDAFSIASVGIAGAVALLGIGAAAAERIPGFAGWRSRFAVSGLLATLGLATLYLVFPVCARGPFSQVSPEIAFWIDLVKESRSMGEMAATSPSLIGSFLVLPVVALIIAAWRFVLTTGRERTLWLCLLVLVAGGIGLQLWQIRGTFLANAYAGLPIAWLVARLGQWGERMSMALTRVLLRLTPPLLLAILPATAGLLVSQASGDDLTKDPSAEESDSRCDPISVAAALDRIAAEGPPLLIAAPIDLGPSLLLLTRHQVLGAPYHRNTEGLRDLRRLLYAEEASAKEVVRRRGVDVILVCPGDVLSAHAREDGMVPFSERLREGDVPEWVQSSQLDGGGKLFVVDR
jgi:hypothetical protein